MAVQLLDRGQLDSQCARRYGLITRNEISQNDTLNQYEQFIYLSNLNRTMSKNKNYVLTDIDVLALERGYNTQNVQHDIFNNRFTQIQFSEPNEYSNLYSK